MSRAGNCTRSTTCGGHAGSGGPRAQNRPRGSKSIDFDVSGLALEGPGLQTSPGGPKASILSSAGLLWRAPGSKHAPGVLIDACTPKKHTSGKGLGDQVSGCFLQDPAGSSNPASIDPQSAKSDVDISEAPSAGANSDTSLSH